MKKRIKYVIIAAVALIIAGAIAISAIQPMTVETVTVSLTGAEASFTELGHVREDRQVQVYPLVGGEILSINVSEGQFVQEGDVLVTVDPSDILHEIEQIRVSNQSILAQIDNLDIEEATARASYVANRNVLQSELRAIDVQQQMTQTSEADIQRAIDENIRLQNIVIEQSLSNVQNAINDLERARILYDAGIITRLEFEAYQQALDLHRTELAANEQRLQIISSEANIIDQSEHFAALRSSIQAQIQGIETSLAQLSSAAMQQHFLAQIESNNLRIVNLERTANYSTVTSPVSGIIRTLHADFTNILNPSTPVAEIITASENFVEVFVSTSNISDLSAGDAVDLIFIRQSGDVTYPGTIYSIDDRAESRVSILGVEERRVRVLIEPTLSSNSFRSGFDVDVRFITYSEENKILIPRTAVFEQDGRSMAYVIENGIATSREIVPGSLLRTEVVVESGLTVGDRVIRDARQSGLNPGVRVVD
jgi:HlyD family secretion protein